MLIKMIPRTPFPHTLPEIFEALIKHDVPDFSSELLDFLKVKNGILVSSGRESFYYILKTLLKKGDEIILPAFSCNVLLGAISKADVTPVFSDVSIASLNMEIENIKPLITDKTKAILVTHQFGYPTDIEPILTYCKGKNITIIEDAAPAFGAKYKGQYVGTFGDVSFFSFQQSKVISTIDGGLIVGKSEIIDKIYHYFPDVIPHSSIKYFLTSLKTYSMKNEYIYFVILTIWSLLKNKPTIADRLDINLERYTRTRKMLSPFQVKLGMQQLNLIQDILHTRNETARLYQKSLDNLTMVIRIPQTDLQNRFHTYARFPILVKNKYQVYETIKKLGVDLGFTFSYTLPQYFMNNDDLEGYINTNFIINHILNIPIHRRLQVNHRVIKKVRQGLIRLENS